MPAWRGQVAAGFEVIGQAPGLVVGPCVKGEHELALVDQAVLKREQTEQEIAVAGGSHGVAPIVVGRAGAGPGLRPGPGMESHRSDIAGPPSLCIRAAGVSDGVSFLRRSKSSG